MKLSVELSLLSINPGIKETGVLPEAASVCFPPTDLDECKANEAACVHPALCDNTYGGYRCICNGTTEVDKTQSCVLGKDPSCRHDHSFITYLR